MPEPTTDIQILHRGYDEELDQWVDVTPAMQDRMALAEKAVAFSKHLVAATVKMVFDEKLYLARGCSSKKQAAEQIFGISERSAHHLYKVADTFGFRLDRMLSGNTENVVSRLTDGNTENVFSNEDENASTENVFSNPNGSDAPESPFLNLGISHLQQLTRLEEEELERLKETKTLTDAEGNTYTLDDLEAMSARKMQSLVSAKLKPYKARLEQEEEARQQAEAERDLLRKELADMQEKVETARQLERRYGDPAKLLEAKKSAVRDAHDVVDRLGPMLVRLGVDGDDPIELRHDVMGLFDKLLMFHERAMAAHEDVRASLLSEV